VDAHYRGPRILRKGFFDKNTPFIANRSTTQQNHTLTTELCTENALFSAFRYYIALATPNTETKS
ncbi:hypothetical protein, partial [Oceanimonas baumannii]|uniref:hypothetical protein n=1 Tax=Oceanimonas baumannii TaxID=129578 RepID=UPI003A8F5431